MTSLLETEKAVFSRELGSPGNHVKGRDGGSYVSLLKSLEIVLLPRLVFSPLIRSVCGARVSSL